MSEEAKFLEVLDAVRATVASSGHADSIEVVVVIKVRRKHYEALPKDLVKKLQIAARTHRVQGHDDYEMFDIICG